mmetsp:Transcript_48192/g.90252  ORF Transcript_48192/g.90252 Transcript_48192/m.90252 type:complete len:707 (+) Transcript_48192:69-2189(+)
MKSCSMFLVVALVVCTPPVIAVDAKTNPLTTTIALLTDLETKIKAEGAAEESSFAEFTEWCKTAATNSKFAIETGTAEAAKLTAEINKQASIVEETSAKISDLAGSIATEEAQLKDATSVRTKETADFASSEAELLDALETLSRATTILEREMSKNPASFAQMQTGSIKTMLQSLSAVISAAAFSSHDQQKLMALVQAQQGADAEDDELAPPAAAVYKTHSTNILDLLEDMKEKAESELAELRKSELSATHSYEMTKQSLEDSMEADGKNLADEKKAKSAASEAKATAEGDLAQTEASLASDKEKLAIATANCNKISSDHDASVAARASELAALAEAKKVLSETTAGAESQTYSFLQKSKVESTLRTRTDLANAEIVALVKKLAKQHHSATLAQLASRIATVFKYGAQAGEDPFVKVKGLISDLIAKLEKEASAEAGEKAFCDSETAKTEAKKSDLEADIAKLTVKIDSAVSKSASLKADAKEVSGELAALAAEQAEMDSIRSKQKSAYVQAKADLELGLSGVRKALQVLRDFYGAALLQEGGAASFEQQPAVPVFHSTATASGGSIIDVLEVVESDFAKNLVAEEAAESDAASTYETTTQSNKVTKAKKEQDVKYMTKEAAALDKSVSGLTVDKDSVSTELSAVLEYYAKMKERCVAKPETYESRKARREAEIEGLKQALSILESETAFVQRRKRGSRFSFLGLS